VEGQIDIDGWEDLFDEIRFVIHTFVLSLSIQVVVYSVEKDSEYAKDFLWGWGFEGRKIAWTAWDKVCMSREAGGLSIINVRLFNLALLRKWI